MAGRSRAALAGLLFFGAPLLSGCIAAAIVPVAAAGMIARKKLISGADVRRTELAQPAVVAAAPPAVAAAGAPRPAVLASAPGPAVAPAPVPIPVPPPVAPPTGMQYLYGSGEAAALSIQAYQSLWNFLSARVADRKAGVDVRSVVLAKNGGLETPKFVPCGKRPLAVVFDIDETVLLNLGYENDAAHRTGDYDDGRWKRWEATGADKVVAVPGAVEAIDAARRAGVLVVFNSNRSVTNAKGTIAAISAAGLGPTELGKTLWLRNDDGGSSGKDERRWAITEKYCVVALVGDQLGDFSDLFNPGGVPVPIRRNMVKDTLIAAMWGSGWFMLPNPVYGTGLHGDFDDLFPGDKRWTDPGETALATLAPTPGAPPAGPASATPAPPEKTQ